MDVGRYAVKGDDYMSIENIRLIHVNDNNLYVKMLGEGEPIIFLHGGPGSEHRFFFPIWLH